jgi:ATP-binding cassette subfamily B protein
MKAVAAALRVVRGRSRVLFAAILALQLGVSVLLVAQYLVLRTTLGYAASPHFEWSGAWPRIAALAAVYTAAGACQHLQPALTRIVTEFNVRDSNQRVIEYLGDVDLLELDVPAFHDRLVRVVQLGMSAPVRIVASLVDIAGSVLYALGLVAAIAVLAPPLLPLVACFYVPATLLGHKAGRRQAEFAFAQSESDRERNLVQSLYLHRPAAAEIRVWGMQERLIHRWQSSYRDRLRELRTLCLGDAARGIRMAVLSGVLSAGTIAYLCLLIGSGRVQVVSAAVVGLAMFQLSGRAQQVTASLRGLVEAVPFIAEMTEIYRRPLQRVNAAALPLDAVTEVAADDVSFAYPAGGGSVLDGATFSARLGEVVAVVGPSGTGKSTLVGVLSGLYTPGSGAVRYDGEAVRGAVLRASTAVVFQEFAKLWFTVEETVTALDAHTDGVARALHDACADGFVRALPAGASTRLGTPFPGGVDLSIGEWQRLALARALWADRAVLILDEPTSALDDESAARVIATLRARAERGPVIAFTHDARLLDAADRRYRLDGGRVVEADLVEVH